MLAAWQSPARPVGRRAALCTAQSHVRGNAPGRGGVAGQDTGTWRREVARGGGRASSAQGAQDAGEQIAA